MGPNLKGQKTTSLQSFRFTTQLNSIFSSSPLIQKNITQLYFFISHLYVLRDKVGGTVFSNVCYSIFSKSDGFCHYPQIELLIQFLPNMSL